MSRALGACAGELAALADLCEALQAGLAPALQSGAAIEEAQALDILTQSLSAVADYLHALADGVPKYWTLDCRPAAATVQLADLARRLAGGALLPAQESGEVEMFGTRP